MLPENSKRNEARQFQSVLKSKVVALFLMVSILFFGQVQFADAAAPLIANIFGAGEQKVVVVFANPEGKSGKSQDLYATLYNNLSIIPFMSILDSRSIPGGGQIESPSGANVNFNRFLLAGAQYLVTTDWISSKQVELRTFEVSEGRFLFGNRYNVAGNATSAGDVADEFCADFLEALIGNGDFFRSTMAFVKSDGKAKKDLWTVKPNGRYLHKLTNINGQVISPTLSVDGRLILFSHIDTRTHGLGIYDMKERKVRRVQFPGNTVIGPAFFPDNRVAVSLTDGKSPSIFLLDQAFQKQGRITNSQAIDVSPSIDAAGTKMVFTSNRLGNPHIFLQNLQTGSVERVTTNGKYNTDPAISPDGTVVAFARQQGSGHRIFVYDLVTKQERQISFGPGSDEQPVFSPDNYFVAFMSSSSGKRQIYLTTRYGGRPTLINTGAGDAAFPAWGNAHSK